jgi:23S rRNA pseudouridine955/2504/2580 synthase
MFREGGSGRGPWRYLLLVRGAGWTRCATLSCRWKYLLDSGGAASGCRPKARRRIRSSALLARWEHFSLLEAELRTGRTHQIRVHCAHLGFPIAGDEKYGDFALNRSLPKEGLKRMFLHAWKMKLPHPASGKEMDLVAPLPEALDDFLKKLSTKEVLEYGQTI